MNLTLKNIPDGLHQKLRETAEQSGRSLNKLIIYTLEQTYCAHKVEHSLLVEQIKRRRNSMSTFIKDESLTRAINESVVATAGNAPSSLRSGRLSPAVPHFKRYLI